MKKFTVSKMEHKSEPLISTKQFILRILWHLFFAFILIGFSLGIGTIGYVYFGDLNATDAFLNASMILTGMGPVDRMPDDAAKWFASFYAIYSGVAFLTITAIIITPLAHRLLHKLHLQDEL